MICSICGGDINEMGMDNVSPICGAPVCESCAEDMSDDDWSELKQKTEEQDEALLFCDDCIRFNYCFNAVDLGPICGDFER